MQRQGVSTSSNGGPFLEACTPYDAEPSICEFKYDLYYKRSFGVKLNFKFSNQWVTYLQFKWQDCIFQVGTLKILIHQNNMLVLFLVE